MDEAERWCNEKLIEQPDSLPVLTVLYKIYLMQGEPIKAMGYVDKALEVVGDDPDANRTLLTNLLVAKSNILIQRYQKTSDKKYLEMAVVVFEQLLIEQPKNTSVLNNTAYILASNDEQLDKAVEYARKAHELAPNKVDCMDTYAYVLCKTGDYKQANQLLQRAFQTLERTGQPPSWEFYEHFGMVQKGLGQVERARESYEKALETGADNLSEEDKERLQAAIEQFAEQM